MPSERTRPLRWIAALVAIATAAGMGLGVTHLSQEPFLGMSERGAQVALVSPGGPAERAGLRGGDLIVEIAGTPVEQLPDPSRYLRDRGTEQPTRLVILREGLGHEVEIQPEPLPGLEIVWNLALAIIAGIILLVGAFVFAKKIQVLTAVFFGICLALACLLFRPYLPPTSWGYWISSLQVAALSTLLPALLLHFFMLFPYQRAILASRRSLLILIYLPCPFLFVMTRSDLFIPERFGLDPTTLSALAENGVALYWSTALVLSVVLFVQAYRRSPLPTVRKKLQVTLLGTVLGLVPLLLVIVAHLIWPSAHLPGDRLATLSVVFLPASFGYAILRHGVFDIEFLVKRSLVYSAITSTFILVYFVVFFALRAVLRGVTDLGEHLGTVLAIAFVALIMSPVRTRLQERVDRWFYPDRYDTRRPLRDMAIELREAEGTQQVETVILRAARRSIGTERAAIFRRMGDDDHFTLTASIGSVPARGEALRLGHSLSGPLFRLGDPTLRSDLEAELPYGFLPPHDLHALHSLKARVLLPLISPKGWLGILVLGPRAFGEPYRPPEMDVLERLQTQSALALENAMFLEESRGHEEYKKEMEIAHSLQQQLLPTELPKHPSLDLAAYNKPSREVGGDYYDCQMSNGSRGSKDIILAIGDVSGKGVPAALLMANVQATFRAEAKAGRAPEEILAVVNQRLCTIERPDRFVSLFCARFDLETRRLRYANGGHLPPILIRSSGEVGRLERGGLLLGIKDPIRYEGGEIPMEPGDLLLLYTDGVIERGGADATFGETALQAFAARKRHLGAQDLVGHVVEELERSSPDTEVDDTTILVLKVI